MGFVSRFLAWLCSVRAGIPIVSNYGLDKVLIENGLKEDFDAGRIKCADTGQVVTRSNLAIIRQEGGKVEFVATMKKKEARG